MSETTNDTKEGFVKVLNGIFKLGLSTDALAIYCYDHRANRKLLREHFG